MSSHSLKSDLWPSAIRTETRKWRERNYTRILRFKFSASHPHFISRTTTLVYRYHYHTLLTCIVE